MFDDTPYGQSTSTMMIESCLTDNRIHFGPQSWLIMVQKSIIYRISILSNFFFFSCKFENMEVWKMWHHLFGSIPGLIMKVIHFCWGELIVVTRDQMNLFATFSLAKRFDYDVK